MAPHNQYDEHDDDKPIGRVLTRREMLALLAGFGGMAFLAACDPLPSASKQIASTVTPNTAGSVQGAVVATATPLPAEAATATSMPVEASPTADTAALPSCVVRPELTEGPYFVDERLERSDIRSDPSDGTVKEGLPLALTFVVSKVGSGSCAPLQGAYVDVWHCDALGVYSDASDPSFNTKGQKFLRGYQVTDANGQAKFITIYPGWYQGRAVHIHFKIRTGLDTAQTYEFTSQLFFDDGLSDQVYSQEPYAGKGQRTLMNSGDSIYRSGGDQLLLRPVKSGDGYAATFDIGLQMS